METNLRMVSRQLRRILRHNGGHDVRGEDRAGGGSAGCWAPSRREAGAAATKGGSVAGALNEVSLWAPSSQRRGGAEAWVP